MKPADKSNNHYIPSSPAVVKVIYHHNCLGDGAEGIHITQMIRAFKKIVEKVHVISPTSDIKSKDVIDRKRFIVIAGLKKILPETLRRFMEIIFNVYEYFTMRRIIRQESPCFVFERYAPYHFAGVLAANHLGIPIILEVNTPYSIGWTQYFNIPFLGIARKIEGWVFRHADMVITVSEALKEILKEQGIPDNKIFSIHNGICLERYQNTTAFPSVKDIVPAGRIVVGFVGSLRPWHGIDILLKSLPELISKQPDIHFLIVGSGPLKNEVIDFCAQNSISEYVTLAGEILHERIPQYLACMDICVMPNSNSYGSPMKIFEYMAMERAIIAPRLKPIEEIITSGVEGMLVTPGDVPDFVEKTLLLCRDSNLRIKIGKAARNRVVQNFTWDKNAQRVVQIYYQYLGSAYNS